MVEFLTGMRVDASANQDASNLCSISILLLHLCVPTQGKPTRELRLVVPNPGASPPADCLAACAHEWDIFCVIIIMLLHKQIVVDTCANVRERLFILVFYASPGPPGQQQQQQQQSSGIKAYRLTQLPINQNGTTSAISYKKPGEEEKVGDAPSQLSERSSLFFVLLVFLHMTYDKIVTFIFKQFFCLSSAEAEGTVELSLNAAPMTAEDRQVCNWSPSRNAWPRCCPFQAAAIAFSILPREGCT